MGVRPKPLRAPWLLLLLAAPALSGCMSDEMNPIAAQEKKDDERAKLSYYTDAAKTYFEGGKYESSAQMWTKVLAITPDDQWARFGLAKSLQMQGSIQSLRRAEAILVDLERYEWQHPQAGDVKFRVHTALATTYSDIADYYDRDVRVLDARLQGESRKEAAVTLREQKQKQIAIRNELLSKSIPYWELVLQHASDDPYGLAGLAKANLLLGNDLAGIGYAKRYIALSHESQLNWRDEYKDWEKTAGKQVTDEQRKFFIEKIQGAKEKEKGMLLLLGSVHMRREEFADAVEAYDAVIERSPSTMAAYVERAQAYAALNQHGRAVTDIEEYLKLTDPVKHRQARLRAAELLERYRRIEGTATVPAAAAAPAATPPHSTSR